MQFSKKYTFLILILSLVVSFKSILSCPTSLGKNLLDANQISYKDISKQAMYE